MRFQGGQVRRRAAMVLGAGALVGTGGLTAGASAAGLSSETPQQILAAAGTALKSASSYELHTDSHRPGQKEVATLIFHKHGAISMHIELNGQKLAVVLKGKRGYMKATPAFWVTYGTSKSLAKVLAPHWYKLPASQVGKLTGGSLGKATATSLTKCEAKTSSELTNAGTATVAGHSAIILKSPGTTPGTHPETIAVAATGKPYLLRVAVTGGTTPGPVSVCNPPDEDKQVGSTEFTHFNSAPAVKAPAHAVKLPMK